MKALLRVLGAAALLWALLIAVAPSDASAQVTKYHPDCQKEGHTVDKFVAEYKIPKSGSGVTGQWTDPSGDFAYLFTEGGKVRGFWVDGDAVGVVFDGKIESTSQGKMFIYKWCSTAKDKKGRNYYGKGQFFFMTSADGRGRLGGTWGYKGSINNGGEWSWFRPKK